MTNTQPPSPSPPPQPILSNHPCKQKRAIVYYISGHGYGHFTRSATLIHEILNQHLCDVMIVRTRVSSKLFRECFSHDHDATTISTTSTTSNTTTSTTTTPNDMHFKATYNNGTILQSECNFDLDAGTIQSTPLDIDPIQTLSLHLSQMQTLKEQLQQEEEFLATISNKFKLGWNIRCVLCDASPIGIAAAHTFNIPSVLVSNFDWHSILHSFLQYCTDKQNYNQVQLQVNDPDFLSKCQHALDTTQDLYSHASIMIRAGGAVPSIVPYHQTMDVPWICPAVVRSPLASNGIKFQQCQEMVLDALFPHREEGMEYRIVLVTFGGQPGNVKKKAFEQESGTPPSTSSYPTSMVGADNLDTIQTSKLRLGFIFATRDADEQVEIQQQCGCNGTNSNESEQSVAMTSSQVRRLLFGHETKGSIAELTKIADVVLCKPGYGTVCETVASQAMMVYVNREPAFIEEEYLIESLGRDRARKLSRSDFESRRWYSTLCQALRSAKSAIFMNDEGLMGAHAIVDALEGIIS